MDSKKLRLDLAPGRSLLLSEIGEPSNNDLRILVVEAMPQGGPVKMEVGLATPIGAGEQSRGFELTWWRYVAYSVRNESYFQPEAGEVLGQELLGTREGTEFLKYIQATTFATNDYPGPLQHWFLYTEWQCIDVVSDTPPDLRELSQGEVRDLIRRLP
ncbi:hypothetical protein LJR225_004998 [Phenylobacterium sp. LjRoot225]|uniref:hypothetical protein n=1 Tax=Phenylobacterium sp. LjRoot225 TaxID=3342285 RepID=UPI003ED047A8